MLTDAQSGLRMLSQRQVAALLGTSVRTVVRKTKEGLLPVCRPFGPAMPRYRESDVLALIERTTEAA